MNWQRLIIDLVLEAQAWARQYEVRWPIAKRKTITVTCRTDLDGEIIARKIRDRAYRPPYI